MPETYGSLEQVAELEGITYGTLKKQTRKGMVVTYSSLQDAI